MQNTLSLIDLSAIRHNAGLVKSLIGNRFFYAVVKADAYGHGDVEVALALKDIVDGFCVAIADEGVRLRVGGINKPVLVFAPPLDEEDAAKIKFYNLTATIADVNSALLTKGCRRHLAVNTGMNRYGVSGRELEEVLALIPKGGLEGAYSHLYAPHIEYCSNSQFKAFNAAAELIKEHSPNAICHLAASGGILSDGGYLKDGVRCGLLLYGYAPQGFECKGLRRALKVYARLSHTTRVTGGGVGYNVADREYKNLYTYRLGYADGFFRGVPLGEKTLCMDAFISEENREYMQVLDNAEEYAARAGTISYEVLCSVTKRSLRVYEN